MPSSNGLFNPACTRCALSARPRAEGRRVCVPGVGPVPSEIMLYGEAPGAREEIEGLPFVGAAGQELDDLLDRARLGRGGVYLGNTVRCRPAGNATPSAAHHAACLFYTVREIAAVQPKVIVAVGGSALKALTGRSEVGKSRGKLLPLLPEYRADVPVIATYHTAAYLYDGSRRKPYRRAILADLKLARKIARGDAVEARIVTPYDGDEAVRSALRTLATLPSLACDLEWEVLPARKKEPKGMWPWSARGGKRPRPIAISLTGAAGNTILSCSMPLTDPDSPYVRAARRIVARVPTYYHNAAGDLIWLYGMGWEVKDVADCTFILASLLGLDMSLSLETLSSMYTDMAPNWKHTVEVGRMPATDDEWRGLLLRNALDGVATLKLRPALKQLVLKEGREAAMPLYRRVLLPAVQILARTALAGTPLDREAVERMGRRNRKRRAALIERIGDALKLPQDYERIVGSSERLAPYVERATGVTLPRTEKEQRPSITKDVLFQHKGTHPVFTLLRKERGYDKLNSAYFRPWLWLLDAQGDRRLHTVYRLTVARTGRSSAEGELGYTFQQFLRGEQYRQLVRADEGKLILAVDQSQIELRIAAWLADETTMIRLYNEGREADLHRYTAGLIKALGEGVRPEAFRRNAERWTSTVTKDERYGAKPHNFGYLYGGGVEVGIRTARQNFGIVLPRDQAELGHAAFFSGYPKLRPWHESFWADVRRGYGVTPLGRHRTVPDNEDPEGQWRKMINLPVQATASDLALFCTNYTLELLREEYGERALDVVDFSGFIHDSLLLHIDARERVAVEAIVRRAWEHPPLERLALELPVPLVADIEVGERWR